MTGGVGCVQARLTVLTAALCGGWAASSAPAAGTAASWLPSTPLAGFIPAEVWRNSGQVKLYLGGTVTKVVWRALTDTPPLAPGRPRAKLLRRRTARTALRFPARCCPSNLDVGSTVLHFAPLNPGTVFPLNARAKCAAPRRAGARVAPEGGCLSDAASPGSSKAGPSHLDAGASLT